MLSTLLILICAPWVARAQLQSITVPYLGDPDIDHVIWDTGTLILQGTAVVPAGRTLVRATWTPGDGTGPVDVSPANSRILELAHVFNGANGQPFLATLEVEDDLGNTDVDSFRVRIGSKTLDNEVNVAIDHGLWRLHKNFILSSIGGIPSGYWNSHNRPADTASALIAFQINNHREIGDRNEDPYVDTVARGLAHLFTELVRVNIGPQTYGDPDWNGNGFGLQAGSVPIYTGGQVVDAIVASFTPDAVTITGSADVIGRTYRDVTQDLVDLYSWGQVDAGYQRGSWRYNWNSDADNSAAQWWAIGALAAEDSNIGFGVVVPQFVKDENLLDGNFLKNSQTFDGTDTGNDGRYGYTNTNPIDVNGMNTTPSGLVQLNADGVHTDDLRWVAAERFMVRNWLTLVDNFRLYGMFATAKAMRLANPLPIKLMDATLDWYGNATDGVARRIVNAQQTDHSWDSYWVVNDLASAWAIIILTPTIVDFFPVAVCKADPEVTGKDDPIEFDGTASFHTGPTGKIVQWDWDFDDGATDSGPIVFHAYANFGTYEAKLTVTDDQGTTDTTSCFIDIIPPPIPPNADTGGPYDWCLGVDEPFLLDGSGSADLDGFLVEWAWDFDPQPLDNDFDDAFGEIVDVTAFFSALGPGFYDVALRVTDNDGGTNTEYSTIRVYNGSDCPHGAPYFVHPPTPDCGGKLFASVDVAFEFSVMAMDDDSGDMVTLSVQGLPPGAAMDPPLPQTGNPVSSTFRWTPTNGDVGDWTVTFTATDLRGNVDTCSFTITVAECFLLIGDGPGSVGLNIGGHFFQTQLTNVREIHPVTMEEYPSFMVDPPLQGGSERKLQRICAQVVMYNPTFFSKNPDQFSRVGSVVVFPNGHATFEELGNRDGINIQFKSITTSTGELNIRFPFDIDGM